MSRKLIALAALVGLLSWSPAAFAMQCGVQGLTESSHTIFQHACYEFFFNNNGSTLSSGNVVILNDSTGTGVNNVTESVEGAPGTQRNEIDVNAADGDVTNMGTYILATTTADSPMVVGVIDDNTCVDQTYCRVQVRGPRKVVCADSSDAVGVNTAVGTSTLSGQCGDSTTGAGGTLGVALEAGDGTDGDPIFVWIGNVGGGNM